MITSSSHPPSQPTAKKRIETEIFQLVQDIRRIEPCGENHCTYGNLFSDPTVEQYYEALLGTLKAAKRKGVINFKGQILLKGMHDNVLVHIISEAGEGNTFDEKKEESVTTVNTNPVRNSRRMSPNDVKNLIINSNVRGTDNVISSDTSIMNKPKPQSSQPTTSKPKSRKEIKAAAMALTAAAKSNITNKKVEKKSDADFVTTPAAEIISTTKDENTTFANVSSRPSSKLSNKFIKDRNALPLKSNTCADTVATAPVHSMNRAYTKKAFQPKRQQDNNADIFHSSTAGTLSPAISRIPQAESHDERVEREIAELLLDIRRIEPSNQNHCSFGDLFVDEKVEQYYEALVGTLKAAKKKGLISFKGQMLLKGMHDNVQVSIIQE